MLMELMAPPHSVIHFNFPGGQHLFDARPIWRALKDKEGSEPSYIPIPRKFCSAALAIATRGVLMSVAVNKLKTTLAEVYSCPEVVQAVHMMQSNDAERMKNEILLFTDATLFEFRSYLDLIANFTYGILSAINKAPDATQTLSSGNVATILDRTGKLRRYDFLLYLCDQLGLANTWLTFLNGDRNLFTHESAPYCAIEFIPGSPPAFNTIIMRTNITDFAVANPEDYFRLSELQSIVDGMLALAPGVQDYLVRQI